MDGLRRLLLVLLYLNPITMLCMHSRDDQDASEAPAGKKCRTMAGSSCAIDVGEDAESPFDAETVMPVRSSASFFIVNQRGDASEGVIFDNGAVPGALTAAMLSKSGVILLNSAVAIPLLLFSQIKGLPVTDDAGAAEPDYRALGLEIAASLRCLCGSAQTADQKVDTLQKVKQHLQKLRTKEQSKRFFDMHTSFYVMRSLSRWLTLGSCVDFSAFDVLLFGQRDFILLVPHGLINTWQAFGMVHGGEEYSSPFSDRAWVERTINELQAAPVARGAGEASVSSALGRLFAAGSAYRWNVLFFGHGSPRQLAERSIAGMRDDEFFDTLDFFNERLKDWVNVLCWETCYGGGGRTDQVVAHLREKNALPLGNFCMIALNALDAISLQSFTPQFFEEMDNLFMRNASRASRELIENFLHIVGSKMGTGQVLLLEQGGSEFNAVNTVQESTREQERKVGVFLQSALDHAGGVTQKSLEVFARATVLLDSQKLKGLLVALESSTSSGVECPSEFFLAKAREHENVYALVNAAMVGINVNEVPMTELLARRADAQPEVACAFVNHLSIEQRTALMCIAAGCKFANLLAALLSVEMPLIGEVTPEVVEKICALPVLPLARAVRTLSGVQRESFYHQMKEGGIKINDATVDCFVRVYADPVSARVTQRLAAYIEKNFSSSDLPGVVDILCEPQLDAWLQAALVEGALKLTTLLLERGAQLPAGVVNERLFGALCYLCAADLDASNRVIVALSDEQRLGLCTMLTEVFAGKRSAKVSLRGQIFLSLQLLAVAPCPQGMPELNKGEFDAFRVMLGDHAQTLADAYLNMSDAQRDFLRGQLSKNQRGPQTKALACRLLLFFDLISKPGISLGAWDVEQAAIINQLPHDYMARLVAASSDAERNSWLAALDAGPRHSCLQFLQLALKAHQAPWRLVSDVFFGETLLRCLGKAEWRHCTDDLVVDAEVAIEFENVLVNARFSYDSMASRIDAAATIRLLNAEQHAALAELASLFQLEELKQRLVSIGIAVPSHDEVDFKKHMLPSFANYCAARGLLCCLDSRLASVYYARKFIPFYERLTIKQKRQLADCAISSDNVNKEAMLSFAGIANKGVPITPELVSMLNSSLIPVMEFLVARTPEQLRQIAVIAQFLDLKRILSRLKSLTVLVPNLQEIGVSEELVRALNEERVTCASVGRFSHEQKMRLYELAKTTESGRVCAALLADGSIDMRDLPVSFTLVVALNGLKLDECGATILRQLSLEQFRAIVTIATFFDLKCVSERFSTDSRFQRVEPNVIEVTENLVRCLADVQLPKMWNLFERLSPEQQRQLFEHAQHMGFERILLQLASLDIDADWLAFSVIPRELERIKDHFKQARIIAFLSEPQKATLAALAQVFDWQTVKKQLFIQRVPLPKVHEIVVDDAFVYYLNRMTLTPAFFEQFSDSQLMALFRICEQHGYKKVFSAFLADETSERIKKIADLCGKERVI